MKHLCTLLFAASCLTAVGQVTYPYNPDGNADGDIAVSDLQDFLVTYGNPFSPSEIMVGDSTLTYWVEQLSNTVQEQQEMINVLQASVGRAFGPAVTPPWPDFEGGTSVFWEEGTWDNDVWLSGVTGNVNSGWAYYYTPTEDGFLTGRANTRFFIQQIDEVGAERAILNIYSVSDAPSFCIPLVRGVNYRIIRQSSLLDISWTPILSSGPLSIDDDSSASENSGPCQGELTVNYHGHDYELVEIGDQCWFAENLQTTTYNNGDSIPYAILGGTGYFEWQQDPSRFDDFCLYDGFTGAGQFDTKSPLMRSWVGLAYSGYAAMNEALCPIGFRVPTTQDFEVLLGVPANVSVLRGDLLDSPPWGFGSNLSGFSVRMHGSVGHDNTCYENGVEAKLLTSDVGWVQNDGTPHMNHLVIRGNGFADVSSGSFFSAWGRGGAIRCIKNAE